MDRILPFFDSPPPHLVHVVIESYWFDNKSKIATAVITLSIFSIIRYLQSSLIQVTYFERTQQFYIGIYHLGLCSLGMSDCGIVLGIVGFGLGLGFGFHPFTKVKMKIVFAFPTELMFTVNWMLKKSKCGRKSISSYFFYKKLGPKMNDKITF